MSDRIDKKLEENGWEIHCQSPFEIFNPESISSASNQAAYSVYSELVLLDERHKLITIKDAYKLDLIDQATFVKKIIEILESEE